jgi:molybdate transport system substrate-binding protein
MKITGISSMATRELLAELAGTYSAQSGRQVAIESVGGVDAARRVAAGEPFDVVVLASDALVKLIDSGHVLGRVDLARSEVAVAVRAGSPHPDISSEEALRRAVRAARRIGYSTGPSGTALLKLFERWGIAAEVKERLVQAQPGVPVGGMVAQGQVELGFQQLSELRGVRGIEVLELPQGARITTIFSAGVCAVSPRQPAAQGLVDFLASAPCADAKHRYGMQPV